MYFWYDDKAVVVDGLFLDQFFKYLDIMMMKIDIQ